MTGRGRLTSDVEFRVGRPSVFVGPPFKSISYGQAIFRNFATWGNTLSRESFFTQ
jgi:hypothetical protein